MARLGSTLSTHRREADRSFNAITRMVGAAERAISSGKCMVAFNEIAGAASEFGALAVHLAATGNQDSTHNMLNNRYHDARRNLVNRCLRSAPGLQGARRRRRR